MIGVRAKRIEGEPVEWAGYSVNLVGVELTAAVETPWFSFGGIYQAPAWLQIGDDENTRTPIADPVMVSRIVATALSVVK